MCASACSSWPSVLVFVKNQFSRWTGVVALCAKCDRAAADDARVPFWSLVKHDKDGNVSVRQTGGHLGRRVGGGVGVADVPPGVKHSFG